MSARPAPALPLFCFSSRSSFPFCPKNARGRPLAADPRASPLFAATHAAPEPSGGGLVPFVQGSDDDRLARAPDDGLELVLLRRGQFELVQRLLQVVHKGIPLAG